MSTRPTSPKNSPSGLPRVTTRTLSKMRSDDQPITMLTAYDFPTARLLDQCGVDVILVGDSLGMVVAGHHDTLRVTMDQILYHAEMVARGCDRAMVVVDLPFPEGQLSIGRTLKSATRVLQETLATAVKLEGGAEQAQRIEAMVTAGVPVMAHVGLRPQNVHVEGGYRVQRDVDRMVGDAVAAEQAGAFAVLIECVTEEVAARIHEAVSVPTIGIGAGGGVSGQVLVTPDLVGWTVGKVPKFVRQMANVTEEYRRGVQAYVDAVRERSFPSWEESFAKKAK